MRSGPKSLFREAWEPDSLVVCGSLVLLVGLAGGECLAEEERS
jgi:hypothetical protein